MRSKLRIKRPEPVRGAAMKACWICGEHKPATPDVFTVKAAMPDGLGGWCRACCAIKTREQRLAHPERYVAAGAARRARLLRQMPAWADRAKIAAVYRSRPAGHHVDHVIPLRGKTVWGLHVHYNLQYLTAHENLSKGARLPGLSHAGGMAQYSQLPFAQRLLGDGVSK